jgi:hypothetical protein
LLCSDLAEGGVGRASDVEEAFDDPSRVGRGDLDLSRVRPDGIRHAPTQMLVDQADRDLLKCMGHRADLGEDVDARRFTLDLALQTPDLTLDLAEPGEDVLDRVRPTLLEQSSGREILS